MTPSAPDTPFVPDDFTVPRRLETAAFRLEPLAPRHNASDHAAWMSGIEHIRTTPGFEGRGWPPVDGMSLEANLADLERHAADFERRTGFTYTVLATGDRTGSAADGDPAGDSGAGAGDAGAGDAGDAGAADTGAGAGDAGAGDAGAGTTGDGPGEPGAGTEGGSGGRSGGADEVIGCVYIYPLRHASGEDTVPAADAANAAAGAEGVARVSSWVRADRAQLDRPLYEAVSAWLAADWPFTEVRYTAR
ncbi:hypothetical protein [Streptomyces sp. NPDC018031]|uniref:hypothetical protein n=1 Tax=Streptomyces sp. NPDC018031 TaxID=3365033 RepID=UPI00378D80B4